MKIARSIYLAIILLVILSVIQFLLIENIPRNSLSYALTEGETIINSVGLAILSVIALFMIYDSIRKRSEIEAKITKGGLLFKSTSSSPPLYEQLQPVAERTTVSRSKFCESCGNNITEAKYYCSKCGSKIE